MVKLDQEQLKPTFAVNNRNKYDIKDFVILDDIDQLTDDISSGWDWVTDYDYNDSISSSKVLKSQDQKYKIDISNIKNLDLNQNIAPKIKSKETHNEDMNFSDISSTQSHRKKKSKSKNPNSLKPNTEELSELCEQSCWLKSVLVFQSTCVILVVFHRQLKHWSNLFTYYSGKTVSNKSKMCLLISLIVVFLWIKLYNYIKIRNEKN